MNVLVAGGGRTASELARLLVAQNHEVRLVEGRRDVLSRLHKELPTEVIYEGAPAQLDVLERAGVARSHVVVACLPDDADNLAVCFLARERYRVGRTIACVNDPRNVWLFDDRFHIDVALNQANILSALHRGGNVPRGHDDAPEASSRPLLAGRRETLRGSARGGAHRGRASAST